MLTLKFTCDNCGHVIEDIVPLARSGRSALPDRIEIGCQLNDAIEVGWTFFESEGRPGAYCRMCSLAHKKHEGFLRGAPMEVR